MRKDLRPLTQKETKQKCAFTTFLDLIFLITSFGLPIYLWDSNLTDGEEMSSLLLVMMRFSRKKRNTDHWELWLIKFYPIKTNKWKESYFALTFRHQHHKANEKIILDCNNNMLILVIVKCFNVYQLVKCWFLTPKLANILWNLHKWLKLEFWKSTSFLPLGTAKKVDAFSLFTIVLTKVAYGCYNILIHLKI